MIPHDSALRDRIAANLAAHTVREVPHGDEKRAAVAIVIVGSEAGTDSSDPYSFTPEEMSVVPGDITGFDGAVADVAGGAAARALDLFGQRLDA